MFFRRKTFFFGSLCPWHRFQIYRVLLLLSTASLSQSRCLNVMNRNSLVFLSIVQLYFFEGILRPNGPHMAAQGVFQLFSCIFLESILRPNGPHMAAQGAARGRTMQKESKHVKPKCEQLPKASQRAANRYASAQKFKNIFHICADFDKIAKLHFKVMALCPCGSQ